MVLVLVAVLDVVGSEVFQDGLIDIVLIALKKERRLVEGWPKHACGDTLNVVLEQEGDLACRRVQVHGLGPVELAEWHHAVLEFVSVHPPSNTRVSDSLYRLDCFLVMKALKLIFELID